MSMTMAMGSTATVSGSSMGSTGMAMSGMDSNSDSMGAQMSMESMMMVFFTSTETPLFSAQWTPSSTGQYAGTCIFIIALAVVFRALLAVRSNFELIMAWFTHRTDTAILRADYDKVSDSQQKSQPASLPRVRSWKINEALTRAVIDTMMAGVAYLLMLAVMTMNVGYFMSVLAGTFLGSFALGGWTAPTGH